MIHQRCSSSSLHPIQKVTDDVLVTFCVCKLCSGASVSFIQYGPVKREHCGLHSSPLVLFQISALVTLNACYTLFGKLKFFNFKQGRMIPYEV